LPVVDHFGGLVEQFDAIGFGNPVLGFQFGLELFPSVIAWPEKVGCERTCAFADHLIDCQRHVLF